MAAFERVNSGIPQMDEALDNIRLGDNVVFRVSNLEEFKLFLNPYIEQAKLDKRNIIYFRFASHETLVEECPEVKRVDIPLSHRFETFTVDIHNVIADEGLVGIISEVHNNYSIVTTIIGDNSYVSAMDEASGDVCSVRGDLALMDTGKIHVERFKENAEVNEGDRIITSNISTKYLPGILVGYAYDVKPDGNALTKSGQVTPAVDFEHLQKVLVIMQLKADMTAE